MLPGTQRYLTTLRSFGHSVRLRDCAPGSLTVWRPSDNLVSSCPTARCPSDLPALLWTFSALHIFVQRSSHSAPSLKPHDTLLTPQPLLTTQSQLCQSSGIHLFNSLPYKPSCALITLRQTHHHHRYSTCNAEKNIHFSSVLLHFSHF